MMDTFSLEEDDASELFITQESRNNPSSNITLRTVDSWP